MYIPGTGTTRTHDGKGRFQNNDVLAEPCRSVPVAQSPQSMLLTADQNNIMRLPNYSCFMRQQVTVFTTRTRRQERYIDRICRILI